MDNARKIEDCAAEWLVRRDRGPWGGEDRVALEQWLGESTAHVVAYVRLEAAWKEAERLKSLGAGRKRGVIPSPEEWTLSPIFMSRHAVLRRNIVSSLRRRSFWAIAAGVLLVMGLGLVAYWGHDGAQFRTPTGGLASVPMADGSKVTLNTDSEIRVELTKQARRVRLEQGEAFFEVAKDPQRPFVVNAGREEIVAVGTAFSVRRNGDDVQVAVTEGSVRVVPDSVAPSPLDPAGELLSSGAVARAEADGIHVQRRPIQEVEEALSWRSGYLVFRETALADAVAEFNRYNARKIVIEDPKVAAIRVSGKFGSTKYEAFVRLLEGQFPIQATYRGERVVLAGKSVRG